MPEQPENKTKIKCLKVAIAIACALLFVLCLVLFFVVEIHGVGEMFRQYIWVDDLGSWLFWGFIIFLLLVFSPILLIFLLLIAVALEDRFLSKLINPVKLMFGLGIGIIILFWIFMLPSMVGEFADVWIFFISHSVVFLALFIVPYVLIGRLCRLKRIAFFKKDFDDDEYY